MPDYSSPLEELEHLAPDLVSFLDGRDAVPGLLKKLRRDYASMRKAKAQRAWEVCGNHFRALGRLHEALEVYWALYQCILDAQVRGRRISRGMPLVWMSECYRSLGFPVHAKRYLMLTLCEDALGGRGFVSPEKTGSYFRLVWQWGMMDEVLRRYAREFHSQARTSPGRGFYPEALLQSVDDDWLTELPSAAEALCYRANTHYINALLRQLGGGNGTALEVLATYLMSCIPGCRTRRRARTYSTDHDVVCALEGPGLDFRSEFGRHFMCECKDWSSPVDVTAFAKFARVLDSTKSRFGVLFSKKGISGRRASLNAEREQLKLFQDRGVVVVVVDEEDLREIGRGFNFITMLRRKYEEVRLDLRPTANEEGKERIGRRTTRRS